jgi:hypothetical protein
MLKKKKKSSDVRSHREAGSASRVLSAVNLNLLSLASAYYLLSCGE